MQKDILTFVVLHIISITCALLTFTLLSCRISTNSVLCKQKESPAHRLIRVTSLVWALISFLIILPGIAMNFETDEYGDLICQTQGYLLTYLFVFQHTLMLLVSYQIWLLLVRMRDVVNSKGYYIILFSVPAIAVTVSCLTSWIYHNDYPKEVWGIEPRRPYCFWFRPAWMRMVAFAGWYLILGLPGAILSIWVTVTLIAKKIRQKNQFNVFTAISSGNGACFGVANSTIYRSVFFATSYTVIAVLSFIPTLINLFEGFSITNEDKQEKYDAEGKHFSLSELATVVPGIALFVVYGTGLHARTVIYEKLNRI